VSSNEDLYERLVRRIDALEAIAVHTKDPEDQRLDRLLRKVARSVEMTAWLGGFCIKVAPIIAVVWWLGEEGWRGLAEWMAQ